MEALRIKISQYKEAKRKVKVIVTCDTKQNALMEHLRDRYKFDNVNIDFYYCLKDVQVNDDLGVLGQLNSITDLNSCVRRLAQRKE